MSAFTLDAALAWAARGFRVFPIQIDGRRPLGEGWTDYASTNPEEIRRLWTDPLGNVQPYNVGFCTTGWVVIDIDVKNGGVGLDTFANLELDFDTLTIKTPSGGYHLYYSDFNASSSPLGKNVDIRSNNSYVLAPGSVVEGRGYTVDIDQPVIPVPSHVRARLRAPHERREASSGVELDRPGSIATAEAWLTREAPAAVEGSGGDQTTYNVACKLRDFGVSEAVAAAMMSSEWNARCEPPWELAELEIKVRNAFEYASGPAGHLAPEASFGHISLTPPPIAEPEPLDLSALQFGNAQMPITYRPRPWIMYRLLLARTVTTMIAPGSAGKSTMALIIAAHLAVGRAFAGLECKKPGKSIVYDAEDEREEMSKRLWAICETYGIDFLEARSMICLLGSDDAFDMELVKADSSMNVDIVSKLVTVCQDPAVVMFAANPLSEIHRINSIDDGGMRFVMSVLTFIAREANVAVLVGHHTRKPGAGNANAAGDVNASLGSVATTNFSRLAVTLYTATADDCKKFAFDENERGRYVRLDDAKTNYALLASTPQWFYRKSVRVASGDEVGVMIPHNVAESMKGMRIVMGNQIERIMRERAVGQLTVTETCDRLRDLDPLLAQLSPAALRERVKAYLRGGVKLETGATISLHEDGNKHTIVMT